MFLHWEKLPHGDGTHGSLSIGPGGVTAERRLELRSMATLRRCDMREQGRRVKSDEESVNEVLRGIDMHMVNGSPL